MLTNPMMSENGSPSEKKRPKRTTHVQFFKVCEELRNSREVILDKCDRLEAVAKHVFEATKILCNVDTIRKAMKAVDLKLIKSPRIHGGDHAVNKNHRRAMVSGIIRLHEELGMDVPPSLAAAYEAYWSVPYVKTGPSPATPLKSSTPGLPVIHHH